MNVVIVHYHLNRGGVTQVIANQIDLLVGPNSLHAVDRIAVLHGGRSQGWTDRTAWQDRVVYRVIEGLDYDQQQSAPPDLARRLVAALQSLKCAPGETVVHVHNHGLGKNRQLSGALIELARAGYFLLLQIHDFAEDFRPANYRSVCECGPATIYPDAPHIHYAVLNRRDRDILDAAGIPSSRIHWLPNPVPDPGERPSREAVRGKLPPPWSQSKQRQWIVYPVRAIRRKNLGEALLWSTLISDWAQLAVTLAPLNPVERPSYERWKALASRCDLPCHLEFGERSGLSFPEIQSLADRILTTSVAEGFGMVFLEAWLVDRMLIGRDLPEITADYRESGLDLSSLHDAFWIPSRWIDRRSLFDRLAAAYRSVLEAYGRPQPDQSTLNHQCETLMVDGCVDFARLPSVLQQQVIERAATSREARRELIACNDQMASLLEDGRERSATIAANRQIVQEQYGRRASAARLMAAYRTLGSERPGPVRTRPDVAESVLDALLEVQRFHPIRVET